MEESRHPLEEAVLTNFFHYLWKKRSNSPADQETQSVNVKIPHTVSYEHNFPKGWYNATAGRGVNRKTGKDIDTKQVMEAMLLKMKRSLPNSSSHKRRSAKPSGPGEVVAIYIEKSSVSSSEIFYLNHLDSDGLREFLAWGASRDSSHPNPDSAKLRNGVLQQFVEPGGEYNHLIQVVWSRHLCFIEKRQNINSLHPLQHGSHSAPVISMWERSVTYQGPSSYSKEAYVSPNIAEAIKTVCKNIVTHIADLEHRGIDRMVLYFKTDDDQNLWLLWCSVLQLSGSTGSPVVPRFKLPVVTGMSALDLLTTNERKLLLKRHPSMGPVGESYQQSDRNSTLNKGQLPCDSKLHHKPLTKAVSSVVMMTLGIKSHSTRKPLRRLSSILRQSERLYKSKELLNRLETQEEARAALGTTPPVINNNNAGFEGLHKTTDNKNMRSPSIIQIPPRVQIEIRNAPSVVTTKLNNHLHYLKECIDWIDSLSYQLYSHLSHFQRGLLLTFPLDPYMSSFYDELYKFPNIISPSAAEIEKHVSLVGGSMESDERRTYLLIRNPHVCQLSSVIEKHRNHMLGPGHSTVMNEILLLLCVTKAPIAAVICISILSILEVTDK